MRSRDIRYSGALKEMPEIPGSPAPEKRFRTHCGRPGGRQQRLDSSAGPTDFRACLYRYPFVCRLAQSNGIDQGARH
jgi:hypothetical protein